MQHVALVQFHAAVNDKVQKFLILPHSVVVVVQQQMCL